MASKRCRWRVWGAQLALLGGAFGCAAPARFPLRDPLLVDNDRRPFSPAPEEYVSPFVWDGANQTIFRPVAQFFAVNPAGPAVNVNALDEVPDSSWFTNRMGARQLSIAELVRGSCAERTLDPSAEDGAWPIDKGKDNGANPGFRVNVPGLGKFMLKTDPKDEPERATGATAIASRFYYAMGYFAPCDSVVYFRESLLRLKPGLTVTNNEGITRPFDAVALKRLLEGASRRDGLVRMVSSAWLPGKPLGPYTYEGVRDDDPNDAIPHEDRREVRGGRLLAAWLGHFDSREQNTMDVFIPANKDDKDGPGHVVHYIIDLGDCFGSNWTVEMLSRRLNHAYVLDVPYVLEDFVTLGTIERPWERAERSAGIFNYFSSRDFEAEFWRGEYPNPAFSRMQEGDGAWAARIIARFTDEDVAALVSVGKYAPDDERYLTQTLIQRRDAILRRYFSRLSPLADLRVNGDRLEGVDLARRTGVIPNERVTLRARLLRDNDSSVSELARPELSADATLSLKLPHRSLASDVGDEDARRYLTVEILNGYAKGPLRAHLYDLGPQRGFRLVGIERPEAG